jgi:WD40 repeat protein
MTGAPPPGGQLPGSAGPAGAVRTAGSRARRRVVIAVVLAGALVVVPVLWFVLIIGLWTLGGGDASPPGAAGPAGGAPLTQVAFSPDGTLAAFVDHPPYSGATKVTVADVATGTVIATVTDPRVAAVAISPDDKALAILDASGAVSLRDIGTGRQTAGLPALGGSTGQGLAVAFSPDRRVLAVAYASSAIYLWDPAAERVTASFSYSGTGNILGLAFSPDGTTLAAFDDNNHTYVLAATGHRLATLPSAASSGGPEAVAYSPDSTMLAICTAAGATTWDVAAVRVVTAWQVPGGCQPAAFSPDAAILATGDSDGHIYLHDIATGRTTALLTVPGGAQILQLTFSHAGTTLTAGYLARDDTATGTRHWTISPPA